MSEAYVELILYLLRRDLWDAEATLLAACP